MLCVPNLIYPELQNTINSGRLVRVLDFESIGPGFESHPEHSSLSFQILQLHL